MNILGFDTCLDKMYVVLAKDDNILDSKIVETTKEHYHSAFLISTIKDILKENNLTPSEIDVIATNIGPGSFTGIRACTTAARVFAQASGAKVIGVSSLEILSRLNEGERGKGKGKREKKDFASQNLNSSLLTPHSSLSSHLSPLTLVALDARKDMAYVAVYENKKEILAPQAMLIDDLKELIKQGRQFVICDDKLAPLLGVLDADSVISYQQADKDLGKFLAEIAYEKLQQGCETDWRKLHPLYIQPVRVNSK